jgi:hypothetical protein
MMGIMTDVTKLQFGYHEKAHDVTVDLLKEASVGQQH